MRYGSFGTQNLMVILIFIFDPRKGQVQVKLGEIRSNIKIQKLLTKIFLSCAELSQDAENVMYFYVRQLAMPKIAFQICDVITFTCFWPLHSQKQRYCFGSLYACCLYAFRSHIFRFFGNLENFRFYRQIFLKN